MWFGQMNTDRGNTCMLLTVTHSESTSMWFGQMNTDRGNT